MEIFGVRLVGFNSETLAKLLLTAVIVIAALAVRAVVGAAAGRTSRRATRRSVWNRKSVSLAFGTVAILLLFPIWFDRPDREEVRLPLHFDEEIDRAEGISIASATFELVKAPELSLRHFDGRAARPGGDPDPARPSEPR